MRGRNLFRRFCIPPVLRSTGLFMDALDGKPHDPIPPSSREAYSRLYSYMGDTNFHCGQAVLIHLGYHPEKDTELFDATSAFMGGTLFMGKTCSAFTAGVMAIGFFFGCVRSIVFLGELPLV